MANQSAIKKITHIYNKNRATSKKTKMGKSKLFLNCDKLIEKASLVNCGIDKKDKKRQVSVSPKQRVL